jgi:hypothetical protein
MQRSEGLLLGEQCRSLAGIGLGVHEELGCLEGRLALGVGNLRRLFRHAGLVLRGEEGL